MAENHTLGGRRVSALEPELKGLPVVPFSDDGRDGRAGRRLARPPGLVLEGLHDVRAHRWVPYESPAACSSSGASATPPSRRACGSASTITREAPRRRRPRAAWSSRGSPGSPSGEPTQPARAAPFALARPRASRFTAKGLYDEQWLFHGPPMQALDRGRAGRARTASRARSRCSRSRPSFRPGEPAAGSTPTRSSWTPSPTCSAAGGWTASSGGDVIFPLRMGRLSLHGDRPRRKGHAVDMPDPDPRGRARTGCGWMPRSSAPTAASGCGSAAGKTGGSTGRRATATCSGRPTRSSSARSCLCPASPAREACAVWLAPPGDMARPVWRDVLEWTQLGPEEQVGLPAPRGIRGPPYAPALGPGRGQGSGPADLAGGRRARHAIPADLAIESRCRTADRGSWTWPGPERADLPAISIAHAEGLAVALAARDPGSRAGIDVEPVPDRPSRRWLRSLRGRGTPCCSRWPGTVATGVDRTVPRGQAGGRQGGRASGPAADRSRSDGRRSEPARLRSHSRRPRSIPAASPGRSCGSGRHAGG